MDDLQPFILPELAASPKPMKNVRSKVNKIVDGRPYILIVEGDEGRIFETFFGTYEDREDVVDTLRDYIEINDRLMDH